MYKLPAYFHPFLAANCTFIYIYVCSFSTLSKLNGLCQETAVKSPISHHKLLSSISRYLLSVNRSSFMSISIATASLINDLSFGNAPTTPLRLFSSLFTFSNMFVVFILFQCSIGNDLIPTTVKSAFVLYLPVASYLSPCNSSHRQRDMGFPSQQACSKTPQLSHRVLSLSSKRSAEISPHQ